MAYEKYIKRGGKVYGPYSYKSVKKDGKVITEYLGKSEKKFKRSNKKFTGKLIFIGIISLLIIAAFFLLNVNLTGNVALSVDDFYISGETLSGDLRMTLEPGEFIPSSTKVLVNNAGEEYEFILEDLIDQKSSDGEFYISDRDISGFGEGYGYSDGDYASVSFVLNILESKKPPLEIRVNPLWVS